LAVRIRRPYGAAVVPAICARTSRFRPPRWRSSTNRRSAAVDVLAALDAFAERAARRTP
jgi:hypothetical protein